MSNSASVSRIGSSASVRNVSLLDLDPELGLFLTDEERAGVASIGLTTRTMGPEGTALRTVFAEAEAFGAFVIKGVLIHEIRLGDRTGMRLVGPGDVLASPTGSDPYVLGDARWLPAGPVGLAMFNFGSCWRSSGGLG